MNAYLNYLLEASIGLCLFPLVYQVFLRKETSFRLNRIFLLVAIIASVIFPLINLNTEDSQLPTLGLTLDTTGIQYSEAESVIESAAQSEINTWEIMAMVYAIGLVIFLSVFIIRLIKMFQVFRKSASYKHNHHNVIELNRTGSPFSFFNYIFIGSTTPLTEKEKQQIIAHESIHAKLYHSYDIVLLNVLGIVFWFNPLVRVYKKIFVQLHEFEADARAVENYDMDEYCSLLARVALHSADFKLANHFSNSLTVKRIEMMRTLKQKIKNWKLAAVAVIVPIVFFVVACQDQVENEIQEQYIEQPDKYPLAAEDALADLHKQHPDDLFITLSPWGESIQLDQNQNPLAIKMNDKTTFTADAIIAIKTGEKDAKGEQELWVIFQYKGGIKLPTEAQWKTAADQGEIREIDARPVFTAVEKQAVPPGGMKAFAQKLKQNIQYPAAARQAGIEGKVFIKFIVWSDGKLSGFQILKGLGKEVDEEALRVLKEQAANSWTPGLQRGGKVNSQFVMPIEFELN